MKEDKRKYNGGNKNAGRKPKAQEELALTRITTALKSIYSKEQDEEAINSFLVDFGKSKDGKKFYAEHLLGKPKDIQVIEQSDSESIPVLTWVKKSE